MTSRAEVLRNIAAECLEPEELLAAYMRRPPPDVQRSRRGTLTGSGSWVVVADVHGREDVMFNRWRGLSETVPIRDLWDIAAEAGTDEAAVALHAALEDQPRVAKEMPAYIRRHGVGGHVLTSAQQAAPEWRALLARGQAVTVACAAWWSGEAPRVPEGVQVPLFDA